MALRRGSVRLALCALLIGTASAWALTLHDKAVGVQTEQKSDRPADTQVEAQADKGDATAAPAFITPAKPAGQQGDAGEHAEDGDGQGSEFWPTLAGYRVKVSDSIVAVAAAVTAIFTGLLWRSTRKTLGCRRKADEACSIRPA